MAGSPSKLQAWWWSRQGLDGTLKGKSSAEVLEHSGWARSVAGVGPYLTIFSRAGVGRPQVDKDVAQCKIHELPAARNCTYVVPASDYAIALLVGQSFEKGDMKVASKLGVTDKEVDKLCAGVIKALAKGPMDPIEIRVATGNLSRNLGEEGKKKGLTTTLPLALSRLQSEGSIRRIPVDGRLDQQRYRYGLWSPNPLAKTKFNVDTAYLELAKRYFRWIGPATLSEFQWFSGLGAKVVKQLVKPLGLKACEEESDRMLLPEDWDAFQTFKIPKKPQYALVSSLDTLFAARRDLRTLLCEDDYERSVPGEKSIMKIGGISDLSSHAIMDRGRIVGVWEYDPEAAEIVYSSFISKDKALEKSIAETCEYIQSQVGDARLFSLDSPKSRLPKLSALRKAMK